MTCEASMSPIRCLSAPSSPYTSRPPVPPAPRIRLLAPSSGWTQIATPLAPSSAVGAVSAAAATVAAAASATGCGGLPRAGRQGRGQGEQPGADEHRYSLRSGRNEMNVLSLHKMEILFQPVGRGTAGRDVKSLLAAFATGPTARAGSPTPRRSTHCTGATGSASSSRSRSATRLPIPAGSRSPSSRSR